MSALEQVKRLGVLEVFVGHSFMQSNIAQNCVQGQQQKLGTKFKIVTTFLFSLQWQNPLLSVEILILPTTKVNQMNLRRLQTRVPIFMKVNISFSSVHLAQENQHLCTLSKARCPLEEERCLLEVKIFILFL